MGAASRLEKRRGYFGRLEKLLSRYSQVLIVQADNVGSKQMASVRHALRGKAVVLMGKNTMIRTCLKKQIPRYPQLQSLLPLVKENIGFVFCISPPHEVRDIILKHKVPAPARQGVVAPNDVFIPAGPTGMDPGSTSFFQALGIATKIVKGQIEIQTEVQLIVGGEKVSASASTLLQKLGIRPFEYGLKALWVYDDGDVYNANILDIKDEDIHDKIRQNAQIIAALSRQIGMPTTPSVPHSIIEAFKVATSIILPSNFVFKEMEAIKFAIENPDAVKAVTASSDAGKNAGSSKEPEKEKEEEEEEDDMGFSLFD